LQELRKKSSLFAILMNPNESQTSMNLDEKRVIRKAQPESAPLGYKQITDF